MRRLLLFIAVLLSGGLAFGQNMDLPNDPQVKKGKLDNGLTYYIRHNDKPAGRAEFYLATNVGAIQETPDQDGLAHFLEHMCFNGTKNFPDKGILDWLQSIGASFGGNVNASTGVEQTTYMLNNIPLIRPTVVDTCILIMHDYSAFVLNKPEEIDKERGVIIEERRSRRTADWRMHEKSLPYYYGTSKYGSCTLIGSQENLENFKPESLTTFYHTWYHPDMQALVIVGDINVDETLEKVKKIFSDIPYTKTQPKDTILVPDNEKPVIGIITDPECASTTTEILWKRPATPEELNGTLVGEMTGLADNIISQIMSERLSDLASKPDAPFVSASFGVGNMIETMNVTLAQTSAKDEKDPLSSFKSLLTECYRMQRYGFTDSEIQRAKDNLLSAYDTQAKNAASRTNADFISPLLDNFFDKYAYMDPKQEDDLVKQVLPMMTKDMINQLAATYVTDSNMVIVHKAPEKAGLSHPTEQDFLNAIAEVKASDIKAPAEETISSQFVDPSTLKGSKIKKQYDGPYGSKVIELKNGVKAYLLYSDKELDRISFIIFRNGGLSLVPDADMPSFESNIFQLFNSNSGVGKHNSSEVSKMLSGKNASASLYISELRNGVSGASSKKDFETAMQLAYELYTDYRFDPDAWAQTMGTINAVLPNIVNQPSFDFQNKLYQSLYLDKVNRHPLINQEIASKASMETIERNYKKLFSDAAGLNVIIVGDFDMDKAEAIVCKYLGSLPKGKKAPDYLDLKSDIQPGERTNDFATSMQTPQTTVMEAYTAPLQYSFKTDAALNAISYIMDMRYTTTLREDEGGTYGASSAASIDDQPESQAIFEVYYNCKPSTADKLRKIADEQLRDLAANGPTEEEFDMTVKNFKKNIPESRLRNAHWADCLRTYITRGGRDSDKGYEEAVDSLTPEDIKTVLNQLLDAGNHVEVIQRPQNSTERE